MIARVAAGNLNKQIAAELGLSEVTVKVHRARAMRKMCATSLAHLIKMLEHVGQCDMKFNHLVANYSRDEHFDASFNALLADSDEA